MTDPFSLQSSSLPHDVRVVGFRGSEGISRLFSFEIHFTIPAEDANTMALEKATGSMGRLLVHRRDGRLPFAFWGMFAEIAMVHALKDGRGLARAVLVPRMWRLTQTYRSRIFTNVSLPEILETTLKDGELESDDFELRLARRYGVEEHVCQYGETLFDFASRWMEREGLYYWFEHGDGGEKLIIADNKAAHHDLVSSPVRFFALSGHDVSRGECLETFMCRRRALPSAVRLWDYDYTKPALDLSAHAPVSSSGTGGINIHGARYFTARDGQHLARIRAEALLASETVFTGSGPALQLRAGHTFHLKDHPRAAFDTSFLVTEAEHVGNQGASTQELQALTGLDDSADVYRVHITAIQAAVQFRAPQRTPWPRIYGTEHGTIDGEGDSDYAQIDEHGRYVVRFGFDESDLGPGKASTRVRMMQPHGGGTEGFHFPLRKGTEVLLTFLGGDPDRPVIAGVVPTIVTPSAVTKANHTRNVIQTGGRNRIELEDKRGYERITISTPNASSMIRMGSPNDEHNMIVRTDGDTILYAGQDWDVHVGGHLKEYVAGETDETRVGAHTTHSWANREVHVGADYKHQTHGSEDRKVNGSLTTSVDGHETHTAGGTIKISTDQNVEIWGGGSFVKLNKSGAFLKAAGGASIALLGNEIFVEASTINLKGDTAVNVKATTINLDPK